MFNRSDFLTTVFLAASGALTCLIYAWVATVSGEFQQGTEGISRPIIGVLIGFWSAFGLYLAAWLVCSRRGSDSNKDLECHSRFKLRGLNLALIIGGGVIFRAIMLPSVPIQEIDIYRYVWDGAVTANRLDPYYFGPATILAACGDPHLTRQNGRVADYVRVVKQRPGLDKILQTIHYGDFTSPYPPISQLVFATAVSLVKSDATADEYLLVMKLVLVGFDLLAGLFVILILRHCGQPLNLSIAYWWCPLLIKEIANSGHLDSVAVMLTTASAYFVLRAIWHKPFHGAASDPDDRDNTPLGKSFCWTISAAIAIAAAVAAKIFPFLLVPIWLVAICRRSWLLAVNALFVILTSTWLFFSPMLPYLSGAQRLELVSTEAAARAFGSDPNGLEGFARGWEMNDLLFMIVVENLKPREHLPMNKTPWFAFTSASFRNMVLQATENGMRRLRPAASPAQSPQQLAFTATRIIMLGIFCGVVGWCCWIAVRGKGPEGLMQASFLALAWFWMLSATQNPWYWTWVLPFLAFARGRAWFLVSGIVLAYYLRFWFEYHFSGQGVVDNIPDSWGLKRAVEWLVPYSAKFKYQGSTFFDFYVPWAEFGPILVALVVESVICRGRRSDKHYENGLSTSN
jgi:hypothetical protein